MVALTLCAVVLVICLLVGLPAAQSLILTSLALMWHFDAVNTQLLVETLEKSLSAPDLVAIPLLILTGELMNSAGLSQRLISQIQTSWTRRRADAGLGVFVSAWLLAWGCGSVIAVTSALSMLWLPWLHERHLPDSRSNALMAASRMLMPWVPSAIPLLLYSTVTHTPLRPLLIASLAIGLILSLALWTAWKWQSHQVMLADDSVWKESSLTAPSKSARIEMVCALALPVLIAAGFTSGAFRPAEVAGAGCLYAMLISAFVYRSLTWSTLRQALLNAAKHASLLLFLYAAASLTSGLLLQVNAPAEVMQTLSSLMDHSRLLMLGMVVLFLAASLVLDFLPALLILAPLGAQIAQQANIDPYYFGLIFVYSCCLRLFAPPADPTATLSPSFSAPTSQPPWRYPFKRSIRPFTVAYGVLLVLWVVFPQLLLKPLHWIPPTLLH